MSTLVREADYPAGDFFTLRQLGDLLGVRPATLRQRILAGRLDAAKVADVWVVDRWTALAELDAKAHRCLGQHEMEPEPDTGLVPLRLVDLGHAQAVCRLCDAARKTSQIGPNGTRGSTLG